MTALFNYLTIKFSLTIGLPISRKKINLGFSKQIELKNRISESVSYGVSSNIQCYSSAHVLKHLEA